MWQISPTQPSHECTCSFQAHDSEPVLCAAEQGVSGGRRPLAGTAAPQRHPLRGAASPQRTQSEAAQHHAAPRHVGSPWRRQWQRERCVQRSCYFNFNSSFYRTNKIIQKSGQWRVCRELFIVKNFSKVHAPIFCILHVACFLPCLKAHGNCLHTRFCLNGLYSKFTLDKVQISSSARIYYFVIV